MTSPLRDRILARLDADPRAESPWDLRVLTDFEGPETLEAPRRCVMSRLAFGRLAGYDEHNSAPRSTRRKASGGVISSLGGAMPVEPPTKRAVAFIDAQNHFHAAKEAFGYRYPNIDRLKFADSGHTLAGTAQ